MSNTETLFVTAAIKTYRFPTPKGNVTVENLFQMPLTSKSGTSLNNTAIELDRALKAKGEQSFVATSSDPEVPALKDKLEIVKFVIAHKQAENAAALDSKARADRRQELLGALARKEQANLEGMSEDEIRKELAKL